MERHRVLCCNNRNCDHDYYFALHFKAMTTAANKAISRKPLLAFLALAGALCFPSINLTIEEWKDAVDGKETTSFQPELVIDTWFNSLTQLSIALYAYANRNELNQSKENEAEEAP